MATQCDCPPLDVLPLQNGDLTHKPPILSFSGIPTLEVARVTIQASGGQLNGTLLDIDIQPDDVSDLANLGEFITSKLNTSGLYVATQLLNGFLVDGVTPAAIVRLDAVKVGPDQSVPDTIDTFIYHSATEDPDNELDVGASLGFCVELGLESVMSFHRGDVDDNGDLQLTDAVNLLSFMFLGMASPTCMDAADADNNGMIDITDAIFILNRLFLGGPELPAPGPDCGVDSGDSLGCFIYTNC
jgi:hypothetical protein